MEFKAQTFSELENWEAKEVLRIDNKWGIFWTKYGVTKECKTVEDITQAFSDVRLIEYFEG